VDWVPQSEHDLLVARDGTIEENHHLEFKRQTGTTDGERKETARDLASMAADGGWPSGLMKRNPDSSRRHPCC
jgi:hypothetical protein